MIPGLPLAVVIVLAGAAIGAAVAAIVRRERGIREAAAGRDEGDDLMAVADSLPKRTRLEQELSAWELENAQLRAQAVLTEQCGCFWTHPDPEGDPAWHPCERHLRAELSAVEDET